MSTWVGMAPVIGNSSLDGFAIGALMSGACALAITAPRRTRARQAVGTGGAGAERLARPDELGVLGPGRSAVGREGRSGGYRSRHRVGDLLPGSAPWDDVSLDSGSRGGTFPGDASPRGAFAGGVIPTASIVIATCLPTA